MAEYMYHLLSKENRSVWIAQREGRTKTVTMQPSRCLKMLGMANDEARIMDFSRN